MREQEPLLTPQTAAHQQLGLTLPGYVLKIQRERYQFKYKVIRHYKAIQICPSTELRSYCNILISDFYGIPYGTLNMCSSQMISDACLRSRGALFRETSKKEKVGQPVVLTALHWLPVSIRMYFKIIVLFFKALNG